MIRGQLVWMQVQLTWSFGHHISTASPSINNRDRAGAAEHDQRISETVGRERLRPWNFIRKRVIDAADAEGILQDMLNELAVAVRLMESIEQASSWLFRTVKNRIIDRFRRKRTAALFGGAILGEERELLTLEELLPWPDAGPQAAFAM